MARTPRKHRKPPAPEQAFDLDRFASVTPQGLSTEQDERVRLVEHDGVAHPLLIFATDNGVRVDLPFHGGTLWATQQQMADMFGVKRNTVSEHLVNIFKEGELVEAATSRDFREVRQEGGRRVADKLDAFITFNQWALLTGPGRHSCDEANAHALEQLDLFRERTRSEAEAGKIK